MGAISNSPFRQYLQALVFCLARPRVLVLGDMVADEYILGQPVRLSREAPIPVLEWLDRYVVPGGAANLARNVHALGAEVAVAGVIGIDEPGHELRQSLAAEGIGLTGLIEAANRPTSTKTRVIGGSPQVVSQQIARIDRVVRTELDAPTERRLIDYLRSAIATVDAVIISDYENGVISRNVIEQALPAARERGLVVAVDAHGALERFQGITVATPNQDEAAAAVGRPLQSDDDVAQAGREIVRLTSAGGVVITRGSEGMTVVEANGRAHHLAVAEPSEVRDVTGAGDTVAAVITLALTANASLHDAAYLANLAAGLVVRRLGTATTTPEELLDAISRSNISLE